MNITDFIENVKDQFDTLDNVEVTADTEFRQLEGWTSLIALMIITMIDEEYGVTINGDDMKQCTSIQDIYNMTVSRL